MILCGFPPARPAPQDTKNEKRMRKKIVHPGQHGRALTVIPSPSLRCAACAAAGAGVHTTVYIKPPPAPAGRDAAKGIHKKGTKKMYTLLYTQRIKLCTYYRIQCRINYVHTTLHTTRRIVYTLPYTKRKGKKEEQKRQARVYTNGMGVRLREQAGGSKLGCTKKKGGLARGSRWNRCRLGCT